LRTFPNFDRRFSLFVTDTASVQQISFADVMKQLAQGAGAATSQIDLFHEWWDTANQKPGKNPGPIQGPHCDDEAAPGGGLSTLNNFPYRCPRPEGGQATVDPFVDPSSANAYGALAFVNRFDLADPSGRDCGEYRIVFARNSGKANPLNRNLIIFEARVPNP